ncbi:MAG: hypothetical protein D6744_03640 [Planctomycetota bacterium]|nr:MAG: hypothetical protein D6744_03640 [Planctomycetota bacterium]
MRPGDDGNDVLQQRLISGNLIALAIIALMIADAWLARFLPQDWKVSGFSVEYWALHGALCTALLVTLAALLTRELLAMARAHGFFPLRHATFVFTIGLVVGPYVTYNLRETARYYDESWSGFWLAIALGYAFWMQAVRRGTEQVLVNIATTMFIVFYAGGLVGFMTKLRMEVGGPEGAVLLLFSVFIMKITDVGAYFTGMLFGRTKLIPWLSPKKTWEGLFGGVVVAILAAFGVGKWLAQSGLVAGHARVFESIWLLPLFAVMMALFSIAGDLAGSLLKRDARLKDSSHLIPGMGGVLDILDSTLLGAPAAWFFWTRAAWLAD